MPETRIDRPLLRQLLALGMVALACHLGVMALTLLDIAGENLLSRYRAPFGGGATTSEWPMLLPALPALLLAAALLIWGPRLARLLSGDREPGPAWEPWSLQVLGLGLGVGGLALLVSMLAEVGLPLEYTGPGGALRVAAALAMVVVALHLLRRHPEAGQTTDARSLSAAAIVGATCIGVGAYTLVGLVARGIPSLIWLPVCGWLGMGGQAGFALQEQAAAALLAALAGGWLLWYGRRVVSRPSQGPGPGAILLGLGVAAPVVVAAGTYRLSMLGHLLLAQAVPGVSRMELEGVRIGVPLEALAYALAIAAGVWLIVTATRPAGQAKVEEASGSLLPTTGAAGSQVLGLAYLVMAVSMVATLPVYLNIDPRVARDLSAPTWLIPASGIALYAVLGVLLLVLRDRLVAWLVPSPAAGSPVELGPDWRLPVLTAGLAGFGFYLLGTSLPLAVRDYAHNLPVGGSLLGASAGRTLTGLVLMLAASRFAGWVLHAARPRPPREDAGAA